MNILIFSLCLFICIFVHEFAHMITGKLINIRVNKFSIGFGKKIYGKQINSTYYQIGWIPLGGYVEFDDEFNHIISKVDSWKKILICIAGPLSNILLGLFAVLIVATITKGSFSGGLQGTYELILNIYNSIVNEPTEIQSIIGAVAETSKINITASKLFMALFIGINLSLGIFNLIPLPPLDGGHIVLFALPKAIINSPFTIVYKTIGMISIIGWSIYLLLSDIIKLIF